jgi:hypothetical protein
LIASWYEPRVDLHTAREIIAQASAATIAIPQPDDDVGDALWSLPEVLRVNAELLLWQGGPDAAAAAESKLHCSLDLARAQSSLSWELRAATSLDGYGTAVAGTPRLVAFWRQHAIAFPRDLVPPTSSAPDNLSLNGPDRFIGHILAAPARQAGTLTGYPKRSRDWRRSACEHRARVDGLAPCLASME